MPLSLSAYNYFFFVVFPPPPSPTTHIIHQLSDWGTMNGGCYTKVTALFRAVSGKKNPAAPSLFPICKAEWANTNKNEITLICNPNPDYTTLNPECLGVCVCVYVFVYDYKYMCNKRRVLRHFTPRREEKNRKIQKKKTHHDR